MKCAAGFPSPLNNHVVQLYKLLYEWSGWSIPHLTDDIEIVDYSREKKMNVNTLTLENGTPDDGQEVSVRETINGITV